MTDKHTPMTSNPVQKHANSPTRINKAPQNPPTFTSPPSQIAPHTKSSKNHRTCRLQIGRRDDAAAKAGEGREAGQGAPPTIRAYDPPGGRVIADSGAGLSSRPRPGIRVGREMGRRKGAAPGSGFPLPPPQIRFALAGSPRPRPPVGWRGEERVLVLRRWLLPPPPPPLSPPPN